MSIEASLEAHLAETRTALEEIEKCLLESDDATECSELSGLKEALELSLRETESALLQLKKESLLENLTSNGGEMEDSVSEAEDPLVECERVAELEKALEEMHCAIEDAAKNGQQTETAHFAEWEMYGRGVASKLMVQMGYVYGKGLGREKQGVTTHLISTRAHSVKRAGLGTCQANEIEAKKKTKRGGRLRAAKKRMRQEKKEEEARHDHEGEGVFSIVNRVIGLAEPLWNDDAMVNDVGHSSHPRNGEEESSCSAREAVERQREDSNGGRQTTTREMLAIQEERVAASQKKVKRLGDAIQRNAKNKNLLKTLQLKLLDARAELEGAQQKHLHLMRDIQRKARSQQSERF